MIHQELLQRAVAQRHTMIQRFVETLGPRLLLAFSHVPALGGSGTALPGEGDSSLPPEAVTYSPEVRERFGRKNPDQSLAAHLFNGIFAGAQVAEMLPPEKELRDIEWQVWILGFIVHDYTKIHGIEIEPRYMPQIRAIIEGQGHRLGFAGFLPEWEIYLDDITFLAQNTQKVKDAAMNWSLFPNIQFNEKRLLTLRYLASFADVLVHITRSADVAERDSRGRDTAGNIQKTLTWLFGIGRAPRLAYHQLTEVRGLLSNLINNGLMRALEAQGYHPYLFFPDGVVYLVTGGQQTALDSEKLIDALWGEIGATLAGIGGSNESQEASEDDDENEEEDREGGLRITRAKDYLKVPPVLYELLSFEQLLTAARSVALNIAPSQAKTAARLGSELAEDRGIRVNGKPNEKQKQFIKIWQDLGSPDLPTDARVDRIAEFCAFAHRRLKGIFPTAEWLPSLLLEVIDVKDCMPVERVYRNNGGTPTGWFYAASHYVKKHPHIDEYAVEELLIRVQALLINTLRENKPKAKTSSKEQAWFESYQRFISSTQTNTRVYGRFESAFRDYVSGSIVIDGQMLTPPSVQIDRFARELDYYIERKASNKVQCSLCSSPYEARQQDKSEVLFKPQQYSNKTRLDTSTVVRGICPICALELMLRQVLQNMRAGSAQDEKPITLWLYPTYFFTAETSQVIHDFINLLRDLNPIDLIRHLEREGFTLEALAAYENFVAPEFDDTTRTQYSLNKPSFSDRDPASLFFFTLRAPVKKDDLTDTDAWIIPAFYTLALPLLLDIKVVATTSFMPIYSNGAEFRGTAVLDAPHSFTGYVLDAEDLRIDQINDNLWRLLRLYELHLDVFTQLNYVKWKDMRLGLVNAVAKDVATDSLFVFSYYDRRQRAKGDEADQKGSKKSKAKAAAPDAGVGKGISPFVIERYMAIYHTLRRDKVSFIAQLVDDYAAFYRADYAHLDSAYTVLRPLGTAIDVTKNSSPDTDEEDLILMIAGAIEDEMDRIKNDAATSGGYDPIGRRSAAGLEKSREAIIHFARQFVTLCFKEYCKGDRGILRERANRIRSAANFHYLSRPYGRRNRAETSQAASISTPKE